MESLPVPPVIVVYAVLLTIESLPSPPFSVDPVPKYEVVPFPVKATPSVDVKFR